MRPRAEGWIVTTDDPDQPTGIEMDGDEVEAFLASQGHGTLSLAREGAAYAVPVSFGYDEGQLFLTLLRFGEESLKHDYLAATDTACLTTYAVTDRFDWRSVVVRGELREIAAAEADRVESVMDDSAWFPTLSPPPSPITDVTRYELHVEAATGRAGEAHQDKR